MEQRNGYVVVLVSTDRRNGRKALEVGNDNINAIKFRDTTWGRPAIDDDPPRMHEPLRTGYSVSTYLADGLREGAIVDTDIEINGVTFAIAARQSIGLTIRGPLVRAERGLYNRERNHQGMGNRLLTPADAVVRPANGDAPVDHCERLGDCSPSTAGAPHESAIDLWQRTGVCNQVHAVRSRADVRASSSRRPRPLRGRPRWRRGPRRRASRGGARAVHRHRGRRRWRSGGARGPRRR